jgi:biopolymer transport protein ExbD
MKMKTSQKIHYDAGPNMTPLVDVVMVILIFLMLTGTFAIGEHFLKSNVPISVEGGGDVKENVPKDEPMEIFVRSPGDSETSWIADVGGVTIRSDTAALEQRLSTMRESFAAANKPVDKIQVIITPTPFTRWQHLVNVYQSVLAAKYEKVAFSKSKTR